MSRIKYLPMHEVFDAIRKERVYQDAKWGSIESKNQELAGFLLIAQKELDEAMDGWMKNEEGRHSALGELVQVAAVIVACLQQYGLEGN